MSGPLDGVGVIFDVDGVLVDSYAPHFESWRMLAEELGRDLTEREFAATFGRTSRDIIGLIFGGEIDAAEIRRLDDRKEAIYRDLIRVRVPIMSGARELLRLLRTAGARLAVGSSGPTDNVELVLEALGDAGRFDAVVTGADVKHGKPNPEVFLLGAERMRIAPGRCVVVEDAPAGIEAAHRAGMGAIGVAGSHVAAKLDGAAAVVASLSEISVELISRTYPQNG